MIIEDEDDVLHVYKDFLEKKGYSIEVSAPTADDALRDYEYYRPDLVMIDYRLPGSMNGLEAGEKILRLDPAAKIMIVTAYENVRSEIEKNNFLADKILSVVDKPVRLGDLERKIKEL